jgi:hypothetical protein
MYSHPNLPQIKFLGNLLVGCQGERILWIISRNSGFPRDSGLGLDIPDLKGIYIFSLW